MSSLHSILEKEHLRAADLERIYRASSANTSFLRQLVDEIPLEDPVTQPRASWLLLRSARDHPEIPIPNLRAAVEVLNDSGSWMARLNLCQLLARVTCPPEIAADVFEFLVSCTKAPRPFIRAWSLSALQRLLEDAPEYASEVNELLLNAKDDPSKSVQARLRQMLPRKSRTA